MAINWAPLSDGLCEKDKTDLRQMKSIWWATLAIVSATWGQFGSKLAVIVFGVIVLIANRVWDYATLLKGDD